MSTYRTIHHQGETYAVEIDPAGHLVRAAGPLHHTDPTDQDSLYEWIVNAGPDAETDAAWLRECMQAPT
tara:strand:- start:374 stop:580 length:207 start_codon:yes stop_codon:yes gene_type:complete